jgi:acyl carrier protein
LQPLHSTSEATMSNDFTHVDASPLDESPDRLAPADTTEALVREIVARHARLSVPIDQLDDVSDLHSAGLTSLATVGLMLALEERFEIEFPDALLSRKTFGSIDALVTAVDTLRSARGN